jgi:hypothetical protein
VIAEAANPPYAMLFWYGNIIADPMNNADANIIPPKKL